MNGVVFRRIEYTGKIVSSRPETRHCYWGASFLQALIINNFDYWSNAFLKELWSGSGGKRAIAQKDSSIVTFRELRSLSNSERPNTNCDRDGRSSV